MYMYGYLASHRTDNDYLKTEKHFLQIFTIPLSIRLTSIQWLMQNIALGRLKTPHLFLL